MANGPADTKQEALLPPGRSIAGIFALAGFAVAILAGLGTANALGLVLTRALVSMFICYLIGVFAGRMCEHAVHTDSSEYSRERPIPDSSVTPDALVEEFRRRDRDGGSDS